MSYSYGNNFFMDIDDSTSALWQDNLNMGYASYESAFGVTPQMEKFSQKVKTSHLGKTPANIPVEEPPKNVTPIIVSEQPDDYSLFQETIDCIPNEDIISNTGDNYVPEEVYNAEVINETNTAPVPMSTKMSLTKTVLLIVLLGLIIYGIYYFYTKWEKTTTTFETVPPIKSPNPYYVRSKMDLMPSFKRIPKYY